MRVETITFNEFLDESIKLALNGLRWFLLFLTGVLHILARVAFTFMLGFLRLATWARLFVEQWKPVTPGALLLDGMKGE